MQPQQISGAHEVIVDEKMQNTCGQAADGGVSRPSHQWHGLLHVELIFQVPLQGISNPPDASSKNQD